MESQWTNKYAILRDLSVAQGRKVPAQIVGSVEAGQKPPVIRIKEETEEEYFQNFVGDGDLYTKPDLHLIKEMINMVRESDPGDKGETEDVVIISKLNPLCDDFVPTNKETNSENKASTKLDAAVEVNHVNTKQEVMPQKKRRDRNVAIMSLLAKELSSNAENSPKDEEITTTINQTSEKKPKASNDKQTVEVKLLKPNDFIVDSNVTEAVVKVNQWLQEPAEPQPAKAKSINLSPMNMFKKKSPAILNLESTSMFKRKSDSSSIKSSDSDTVSRQTDNVFVPSTHATEYYKTFIERRQMQEIAQEDIWKRAERLMKEIDSKRREKEKLNTDLLGSAVEHQLAYSEDVNIPGLLNPAVRLPQHRHDFPEECKVCMALAKYRQTTEFR